MEVSLEIRAQRPRVAHRQRNRCVPARDSNVDGTRIRGRNKAIMAEFPREVEIVHDKVVVSSEAGTLYNSAKEPIWCNTRPAYSIFYAAFKF